MLALLKNNSVFGKWGISFCVSIEYMTSAYFLHLCPHIRWEENLKKKSPEYFLSFIGQANIYYPYNNQ